MIRYTLRCRNGHAFDSWFQSSTAFDSLHEGGHLTCAVCGDGEVGKAVMAPAIASAAQPSPPAAGPPPPLSAPASPMEAMIAEMRRRVEAVADDVGPDFAAEARRIHEGGAPARAIYGQATLAEARSLVEDDIPVTPLPWPARRTN